MDKVITLDYGSGGAKTSELIESLVVPSFDNEALHDLPDAASLEGNERLVFSTDSFVVNPYFFPGGNIGKLSVCGTVNDISVSGGIPKYLSLGFIIEEGFPFADLEKIVTSIKETADSVGVKVVTGDTKVVEKGKGDGLYINTAGIGFEKLSGLSAKNIKEGDVVLVSGTVGNHGISVMTARNQNLVKGEILSDCMPVDKIAQGLMELGSDLKVMRDPTRGGLATTLCEFVENLDYSIELNELEIPVNPKVQAACDILGLDPLYAACEGRLIAIVASERAEEALNIMQKIEGAGGTKIIGNVNKNYPGKVYIKTSIGGSRILAKLSGAQLPRIC